MTYTDCPSCSSNAIYATSINGVLVNECFDCHAIFGKVTYSQYCRIVKTHRGFMSKKDPIKPFDFGLRENNRRYHGWLDEDGILAQIG